MVIKFYIVPSHEENDLPPKLQNKHIALSKHARKTPYKTYADDKPYDVNFRVDTKSKIRADYSFMIYHINWARTQNLRSEMIIRTRFIT